MTDVKSGIIFFVAKGSLSAGLMAIGSAVWPAALVVVAGMALYAWKKSTERPCPKRS